MVKWIEEAILSSPGGRNRVKEKKRTGGQKTKMGLYRVGQVN